MSSQLYIRRARPSDSAALSRICLLTADAGNSAEDLHTFEELPGVMYAVPYVHLPSAGGFVLVDARTKQTDNGGGGSDNNNSKIEGEEEGRESGQVVGYVLAAFDTPQFEVELEKHWFPTYRTKYPIPISTSNSNSNSNSPTYASSPPPTEADIRYIHQIHNPPHAHPAALAFSPAHMHIDILPEYQRRGYGRKLISELVRWLRDEKGLEGMWLGMDMRNGGAGRFYERLGFRRVEGAYEGVVGLQFRDRKE